MFDKDLTYTKAITFASTVITLQYLLHYRKSKKQNGQQIKQHGSCNDMLIKNNSRLLFVNAVIVSDVAELPPVRWHTCVSHNPIYNRECGFVINSLA